MFENSVFLLWTMNSHAEFNIYIYIYIYIYIIDNPWDIRFPLNSVDFCRTSKISAECLKTCRIRKNY